MWLRGFKEEEMEIGMLWFDDDGRQDLGVKVGRAVDHYRSKYGRTPDLCFAHPRTLGKNPPKKAAGMKLCSSGSVLPHHFWLGIEDRN
jgi:hypothetical protein